MIRQVPGALNVDLVRHEGDVFVVLAGELDLATVKLVNDALEEIDRDPPNRLVIDLRELSFIDSTGLRLIMLLHAKCAQSGTPELEIRRGPRPVQRIFELLGVADRLPFAGNEAREPDIAGRPPCRTSVGSSPVG